MVLRKTKDAEYQDSMYQALKKPFAFYSNDDSECKAVEKDLIELGQRFSKVEAKRNVPSLVAGSKVYFGTREISQFVAAVNAFRKN